MTAAALSSGFIFEAFGDLPKLKSSPLDVFDPLAQPAMFTPRSRPIGKAEITGCQGSVAMLLISLAQGSRVTPHRIRAQCAFICAACIPGPHCTSRP